MYVSPYAGKYNFSPKIEKLYHFFDRKDSVFSGSLVPAVSELKNIGRLMIDSVSELSELCCQEKEEYFFLREKAFTWFKKIDASEYLLKSPGIEITSLINLVQSFFNRSSSRKISVETALKISVLIEDEVEFDSFIRTFPFGIRSEILKNVVNFSHYKKNKDNYYSRNLNFSFVEKATLENLDFLDDAHRCHNLTYLKLNFTGEGSDGYKESVKLKDIKLNFPSVEEMESDLCILTKNSNFSSLSKLKINEFNENTVIEEGVHLPKLSDITFNTSDCLDETISTKLLNLPLWNIRKIGFIGSTMDPAVFKETKHLESLFLDLFEFNFGEEFVGNTLSYLSIMGDYTIADHIEFPELKTLRVTASSEEDNVFLRSKLNMPSLENLELILENSDAHDKGFLHKEFDLSKIKVLKLSQDYNSQLPDTFRDIEVIYLGNYFKSLPKSTENLDHPLTIHRTIREEGRFWEQKKVLAQTVEVIHPQVTGKRSIPDFIKNPARKKSKQ